MKEIAIKTLLSLLLIGAVYFHKTADQKKEVEVKEAKEQSAAAQNQVITLNEELKQLQPDKLPSPEEKRRMELEQKLEEKQIQKNKINDEKLFLNTEIDRIQDRIRQTDTSLSNLEHEYLAQIKQLNEIDSYIFLNKKEVRRILKFKPHTITQLLPRIKELYIEPIRCSFKKINPDVHEKLKAFSNNYDNLEDNCNTLKASKSTLQEQQNTYKETETTKLEERRFKNEELETVSKEIEDIQRALEDTMSYTTYRSKT